MILNFQEYLIIEEHLNDIDFKVLKEINETLNESIETELDEGIISKVFGAIGGAWLLPKLGRIIAKVLGVKEGLLYNFLTSSIVGAALGVEIESNRKKYQK